MFGLLKKYNLILGQQCDVNYANYSYGVGELVDISNMKDSDRHLIKTLLLNEALKIWTYNKTENCNYVQITSGNFTGTFSGNCSSKYLYFCQVSSYNSPLGMQNGGVCNKALKSTSYLKLNFSTLEFRTEFARYNSSFTKGIFLGKGWCSQSIKNEYFEITFQSDAAITGILMQYGEINNCRYWISKYTLKYYKEKQWGYILDFDLQRRVFNYADTVEWFNATLMQVLQVVPLSANNSCMNGLQVYCLRMEVYGVFTGYYPRYLVSENSIVF